MRELSKFMSLTDNSDADVIAVFIFKKHTILEIIKY